MPSASSCLPACTRNQWEGGEHEMCMQAAKCVLQQNARLLPGTAGTVKLQGYPASSSPTQPPATHLDGSPGGGHAQQHTVAVHSNLLIHLNQAAAPCHQLVCSAGKGAAWGSGMAAFGRGLAAGGMRSMTAGRMSRVHLVCTPHRHQQRPSHVAASAGSAQPASTASTPLRTGVVCNARVHLCADAPRHTFQEHGSHVHQRLVHLQEGSRAGIMAGTPVSWVASQKKYGTCVCRGCRCTNGLRATAGPPGSWCGPRPIPGCTCRKTGPAQWQTSKSKGEACNGRERSAALKPCRYCQA